MDRENILEQCEWGDHVRTLNGGEHSRTVWTGENIPEKHEWGEHSRTVWIRKHFREIILELWMGITFYNKWWERTPQQKWADCFRAGNEGEHSRTVWMRAPRVDPHTGGLVVQIALICWVIQICANVIPLAVTFTFHESTGNCSMSQGIYISLPKLWKEAFLGTLYNRLLLK